MLVRFATNDPGQRKTIVRALAELVQGAGAALVVDGDPQLAARAGADGAHVSGAGAGARRGDRKPQARPDRRRGRFWKRATTAWPPAKATSIT